MRNVSGQYGEKKKKKKRKRTGTQATKFFYVNIRHFFHKTCNHRKFHVVVVQSNDKEMCKKSVLPLHSYFFAN